MGKGMLVSLSFQMKICYNSYGFLDLHQKNKYHSMISAAVFMVMLLFRGFISHRIIEYYDFKGSTRIKSSSWVNGLFMNAV